MEETSYIFLLVRLMDPYFVGLMMNFKRLIIMIRMFFIWAQCPEMKSATQTWHCVVSLLYPF